MMWLLRIWPISSIYARLEWRRRDREEMLVATATYVTNWTRDGADTGMHTEHHVRFLINGHGRRFTQSEAGPADRDRVAVKAHTILRRDRFAWESHGDLPSYARRADNRPRGKLIVIDGGAA